MGMVVRSNIMAMNANRQLGMNNTQVSKSLEKLSSGFRINRAGDDASGLAISEKMKAQIKGLETASSNSQDGISLIQTAEGALTEVHDMLNRMVELSGKAANGTMDSSVDRAALQKEMDALKSEIDRIAQGTNFNSIKLLDGSLGAGKTVGTALSTKMGKSVAGVYVTNAVGNPASAKLGEKLNFSLEYEVDGVRKNISLDFTVTKAVTATVDGEVTAADGTKYTITKGTDDKFKTAEEFAKMVQSELAKNSEFNKHFTTGYAGGVFTFTAVNAGTKGAKIVQSTGGLNLAAATAKTASDAPKILNGLTNIKALKLKDAKDAQKVTDESLKDATFQFGGKTFLVVGNDTTKDEYLDLMASGKIAKDTVVIKAAEDGGNAVTLAGDGEKIAAVLKAETGVNLKFTTAGDADKGIGANEIYYEGPDDLPLGGNGNGLTLQIGDTADKFNKLSVKVGDMSSSGLGIANLSLADQDAAAAALDKLRNTSGGGAINIVSSARADLGALQNRLEHTINNLDVATENMNSANSRIRDTDMAKEMMAYTKMNVLTQAAQAMLAQANQQPQSVLQLLQ